MAQSHKMKVELIRQDHDPGFWSLLSHSPYHLKHVTGVPVGLDEDQRGLLRQTLKPSWTGDRNRLGERERCSLQDALKV
ncbi:hypothetical protein [Microvirga vignae]|uniref:hypothetical protein n=1 Tax=Microvirga vignae TaxID=1225564 RepID=UPI00063FF9D1|nr:hypothetical protein [Microvirga vignae]